METKMQNNQLQSEIQQPLTDDEKKRYEQILYNTSLSQFRANGVDTSKSFVQEIARRAAASSAQTASREDFEVLTHPALMSRTSMQPEVDWGMIYGYMQNTHSSAVETQLMNMLMNMDYQGPAQQTSVWMGSLPNSSGRNQGHGMGGSSQ